VSSRDTGAKGHSAALSREFVVPRDAAALRCSACAVLGKDCAAEGLLDIVLLRPGKGVVPKQVYTDQGWQKVPTLLPGQEAAPAEYMWTVGPYAGQTVRIGLLDQDERPGCSVYCSGFQFQTLDDLREQEFDWFMIGLAQKHNLTPMRRYTSRHFTALSNAGAGFSDWQLRNAELIYALFCDHFGRKGFEVHHPARKLMMALFDSQAGFDAYLGRPLSAHVSGIYHRGHNRLVVYDFGQNPAFQESKQKAERAGQRLAQSIERLRYQGAVDRAANQFQMDANQSTIMHEVAHQLSFNCGLLNRDADVPAWLSEGLACYCESSSDGCWHGIGEASPMRLQVLADCLHQKRSFLSLRELLENDRWVWPPRDAKAILLGYAQSWALFQSLIEEQPQALRNYMLQIYYQRTPERRLADFQQAFGTDLTGLERKHNEYIRNLVKLHAKPVR
jgi:hypothetical protein